MAINTKEVSVSIWQLNGKGGGSGKICVYGEFFNILEGKLKVTKQFQFESV